MDGTPAEGVEPARPTAVGGARVGHPDRGSGRRTRPWRPVLAILLVAPFAGEVLSTSTPPLEFLLPWNLAFFVALYGSGALLCRELTRRSGLGLRGLCLLGAAYAVYEEALVDRFWFDPGAQDVLGLGGYGRLGDTNLLLAAHLTAFHVAMSICSSILLVERVFPAQRGRTWVGRRGLVVAAVALLLTLTYGASTPTPAGPLLAAAALCVLLVVGAFLVPRRPDPSPARSRRPHPRLIGSVAFVCTATHFVLVYALPHSGLPWPFAVPLVLVPVAIGVLVVRRLCVTGGAGPDGLWAVTGILAFFVLLDVLVGIGGRYDLVVAALGTAWALWWLHRRGRRTPPRSADMEPTGPQRL